MLLSRLVRIQLIVFAIASLIGLSLMVVRYLQLPTLMGIGHIKVTLELPAAGGLYRFSNVTYRGVQVGKVTDITVVDGKRVNATLSLDSSTIPADASAHVRSMSAAGEQYVDLQPLNESGPYLRDGSVITLPHTTIPQRAGPMLDQLSALVDSIPKDRLGNLLDETFKGFDGAGYDFGSLLDSSATLSGDFNRNADRARTLVDDSVPLLQSQTDSVGAIKVWAHGLAGVTGQLARNDPQLRTILQTGPGFAQQVSGLLDQIKPTLPVLLANLTTIGQIGVTYHASLEQILVLLPPNIAIFQSAAPTGNPTGAATGDFSLTLGDPPACSVGFLPPSQWRSPADTSEADTPDGLYCKLPQDSPVAVRGARNYPCMGHPGKRAPTVQICDSDKPFMPLALRQHVTGPYPLDPNLIAQGIPPDDRVNTTERLYGPVAGTPLPPPISPPPAGGQSGPPGSANVPGPVGGLAPWDNADSPTPAGPAPVAPSAWHADGASPGPSVAVVHYNPTTGAYMAPDGHVYHQADLRASAKPKAWTDLILGAQ